MKFDEKAATTTNRVMIFGAPKTGKTEIVSKLSEYFDLLWFDLENGGETLRKLPKEQQHRITYIGIPDTRDFPIAIETMLKVVKGNKMTVCDTHGKVNCQLCIKDGGTVNDVFLSELPPTTIMVTDSVTQLTNSAIASIRRGKPDDFKFGYDEWAQLGHLMDCFLSPIQQAKYNVACISHETEVEMEDGKEKLVPTAGTRNFSRGVAKYFDHVIYAEVKNSKHKFGSSTGYANSVLTGSRTDVVLEKTEIPSLLRIFKPELFANEPKLEKVTLGVNTQGANALTNLKSLIKKQE